MSRRFTIGRDRSCDVAVADDSVSRVHAEIWLNEDGSLMLADRGIFGSAVSTYMVRDATPCQFRFFLKFIKHPAANPPMTGNVVVQTMDDFQISPVVYNTREQVAIPIAVVSVAGDLKQTVQLAVPKESTVAPGPSPGGK